MAIANPRIHMICGICGNRDMLSFKIRKELNDDTGKKFYQVYISCKNCSSLTGLEEVIKQEK